MAIKIQLRRDTAANWTSNNPLLLNGEIGIETDTLKFKIGNGSQRWNAIDFYAFKIGSPNGVATLDSSGKIPASQLPAFDTIEDLEAAIQQALSSKTTSNIAEGTNLYFTPARAIAAGQGVFDPYGSATQAVATAATNTATKISDLLNSAPEVLNTLGELAAAIQENENYVEDVVNLVSGKQNILTAGNAISIIDNTISVSENIYDDKGAADLAEAAASLDATTKANAAVSTAASDATSKANAAVATAALDATNKANEAKLEAIALSASDATTKANAAQSAAISAAETDATNKANAAQSAAIAAAGTYADSQDLIVLENANMHAEGFASSAIADLTTSDIPEGSRLYFTEARAREAVASDIADAIAEIPGGGSSITSTTDLPEGTNLYFTNARAVTATNAARTNILLSALSSVDDLRTEVQGYLTDYIPNADRGVADGVAALDSSGKITESIIPTSIARLSEPSFSGTVTIENDLVVDGNLTISGTTTTVNTSEVQIDDPIFYLSANQYDTNTRDIGITGAYGTTGGDEEDHLHTGLVKDVTDGKWKLFSNAPHPINNVIDFTSANYDTLKVGALESTSATIGSVTNEEIQRLSGVTSGVQSQLNSITSSYATTIALAAGVAEAKTYTDTAINGVNNSLDDYALASDRNQAGGYAGLDLSGKISTSAVPTISNSMLQNNSITINGSAVSLGSSVITGYTNGVSGANVNKITYGTSATPPASGNSAGDIYIQY
jgi:hypothetical protein